MPCLPQSEVLRPTQKMKRLGFACRASPVRVFGSQTEGDVVIRVTLATIVKRQCASFLGDEDLSPLPFPQSSPSRGAAASPVRKSVSESQNRAHEKLAQIISEKLDEGDIRGAVRTACSNDVIAPFNRASFEKLKAKHPHSPAIAKLFLLPLSLPPACSATGRECRRQQF